MAIFLSTIEGIIELTTVKNIISGELGMMIKTWIAMLASIMIMPAYAFESPNVVNGATAYDWQSCVNAKADDCRNNCATSSNIKCSDNCTDLAKDKCKSMGLNPPNGSN